MSSWKLKPYFQAHPIKVLTKQPLRKVIENRNHSSRMNLVGKLKPKPLQTSSQSVLPDRPGKRDQQPGGFKLTTLQPEQGVEHM